MSTSELYSTLADLVRDYTYHKIQQRRFSSLLQTRLCQDTIVCPPALSGLIVQMLGDEIVSENRVVKGVVSTAAADRIIVEHPNLFSDSCYEKNFQLTLQKLSSVVYEMGDLIFKENHHAGTVAAFLAFGATLAAHCEDKEHLGERAVEEIITSTSNYLDHHLLRWLRSNGGLNMLLKAHQEDQDCFSSAKARKLQFANLLLEKGLNRQYKSKVGTLSFSCAAYKIAADIQKAVLGNNRVVAETLYKYAVVLDEKGFYTEAVNAVVESFEILNQCPYPHLDIVLLCHLLIGKIYTRMKEFRKASQSFQIVLGDRFQSGPYGGIFTFKTAECFHCLGRVHFQTGDLNSAIKFQQKALEGIGESGSFVTGAILHLKGCCYFELGCIHFAMKDFEQAAVNHRKAWSIRSNSGGNRLFRAQSCIHLAMVLFDTVYQGANGATLHRRRWHYHVVMQEGESMQSVIHLPKYKACMIELYELLYQASAFFKHLLNGVNLHSKRPLYLECPCYEFSEAEKLISMGHDLCQLLLDHLRMKNEKVVPFVKLTRNVEILKNRFCSLSKKVVEAGELYHSDTQISVQGSVNVDCDICLSYQHLRNNKGTVPSEIRARGSVAVEAYIKAIQGGETCVRRVPVMLIGQGRSGKTSVMKSLMGRQFNPEEESTVGIETSPSYCKVSTEIWKVSNECQSHEESVPDPTSFELHMARLICGSLREDKMGKEESMGPENTSLSETVSFSHGVEADSGHANPESELNSNFGEPTDIAKEPDHQEMEEIVEQSLVTAQLNQPADEDISSASSPSSSENESSAEVSISTIAPEEVPEDVATLIEKLLKEVDRPEEEESVYSVLWDFGGQSVYYATHPIFLTARAIYILVHNLSQNAQDRAAPVVKQGMFKKVHDIYCAKTNVDVLDFWMSSVASLNIPEEDQTGGVQPEKLPQRRPPVLLVCTHADNPYGGLNAKELAWEVYGSLQNKPYCGHLFDDVFAVDNTKSGSNEECPEVVRLRKAVQIIAKELPQMKEKIPVSWLMYEKALKSTREQGRKWISLSEAKQIACSVCKILGDQEFSTLLNFLHDQRILIHFSDTLALNEIVVLDTQWLVDVFRKVITVKPFEPKEKHLKDLWTKLEKTGILERKLLEHVWGSLFTQQNIAEALVAIMEKFSLLCPWPFSDGRKQYLVPSMLMSHPTEEVLELLDSVSVPSLFVKFDSGQVPLGFFPRLILQFFQWCQEEWPTHSHPQLFHNFARFYSHAEDGCSVILLCHSTSIEIVVHSGNSEREYEDTLAKRFQSNMNFRTEYRSDTPDVTTCRRVRRQLRLMLDCMLTEYSWLKRQNYEFCVCCTVCCKGCSVKFCSTHNVKACKQEECLHFLSEDELRNGQQALACNKYPFAGNSNVQVKHYAPWFAFLDAQVTALDQCDGRPVFAMKGCSRDQFALALPGEVLEALNSKTNEPTDIVVQLQENLQVDQTGLKHPDHKTKEMVRSLAVKAKSVNRTDVVQYLRTITPVGTTGPLLPDHQDVRDIPVKQRKDLTVNLCGGDEWKVLAENLGLTPAEIRYLDNRTLNPCDAALAHIANQFYVSVGNLYDVLVNCEMPQYADIL